MHITCANELLFSTFNCIWSVEKSKDSNKKSELIIIYESGFAVIILLWKISVH